MELNHEKKGENLIITIKGRLEQKSKAICRHRMAKNPSFLLAH
jgi:hypothetical protein